MYAIGSFLALLLPPSLFMSNFFLSSMKNGMSVEQIKRLTEARMHGAKVVFEADMQKPYPGNSIDSGHYYTDSLNSYTQQEAANSFAETVVQPPERMTNKTSTSTRSSNASTGLPMTTGGLEGPVTGPVTGPVSGPSPVLHYPTRKGGSKNISMDLNSYPMNFNHAYASHANNYNPMMSGPSHGGLSENRMRPGSVTDYNRSSSRLHSNSIQLNSPSKSAMDPTSIPANSPVSTVTPVNTEYLPTSYDHSYRHSYSSEPLFSSPPQYSAGVPLSSPTTQNGAEPSTKTESSSTKETPREEVSPSTNTIYYDLSSSPKQEVLMTQEEPTMYKRSPVLYNRYRDDNDGYWGYHYDRNASTNPSFIHNEKYEYIGNGPIPYSFDRKDLRVKHRGSEPIIEEDDLPIDYYQGTSNGLKNSPESSNRLRTNTVGQLYRNNSYIYDDYMN